MGLTERRLVSESQFLSLPEALEKTELIDGEIVVSPHPSYWHQEVLQRIVFALRQWARTRQGAVVVGQAPLDVRFGTNRILQPDAFVLLEAVPRDHQGPIDIVPVLCVEALSLDRTYDRVTKRFFYAQAGVGEYWVVEPSGMIERWGGDELSVCSVHSRELTSSALPDLSLDVEELFR